MVCPERLRDGGELDVDVSEEGRVPRSGRDGIGRCAGVVGDEVEDGEDAFGIGRVPESVPDDRR